MHSLQSRKNDTERVPGRNEQISTVHVVSAATGRYSNSNAPV